MKVMWDLCSGLGGASSAFMQSKNWKVVRIEINPELSFVDETYIMSIQEFHQNLDKFPKPDLIWFSPPCNQWSNGFNSEKCKNRREGKEFIPDLEIVKTGLRIIHEMNPEYFVIENVMGAREFFHPILGEHTQRIAGMYLWGEFPNIPIKATHKFNKINLNFDMHDPLRANKRALIPFKVSKELRDAIDMQTSLKRWI